MIAKNSTYYGAYNILEINKTPQAGGVDETTNSSYYLYTFTLRQPNIWFVIGDSFGFNSVHRGGGVRPIINLKSSVEVELTGTGEPGTATNPYIKK